MSGQEWPIFPREHYLDQLRASKDSPFIKAITGLRRTGKSTIMDLFRSELVDSGTSPDDIFYLNLEDDTEDAPRDHRALTDMVESRIDVGKGRYLFFDEIQNVEGWETSIRTFYNAGADIYLTGSNSRMLSSELSTKLSGRTVEIHVAPLAFSEYVGFRKDAGKSYGELFGDYIRYGGLPAITLALDRQPPRIVSEMIAGIYNTVYVKDVIERHRIRNPAGLSNLIRFLMRNIGDRTSSRKASNVITGSGIRLSHNAIEEYLDYIEGAFIALRSRRMDIKTLEYLTTHDKFYAQDLGIRNHLSAFREDDIDGILENIVYNELMYRYGNACVCAVGRYEVDFMVDPLGKPSYFQVCTNIGDESTRERELRPLRALPDNYPKTVITYDRFILDDIDGIRIVTILDWLLEWSEPVAERRMGAHGMILPEALSHPMAPNNIL